MFKIKFKTLLSIIVSKTLIVVSKKLFKGGSNFPGRIALKIDRTILFSISKNYKVILITGTNGKTTTSSMLYNIIKDMGYPVISNATGANMLPGIVSCFVANYSFKNKQERYAVIEVDEANLKFVTEYISPSIITITNLFRDQLDRYGEVYSTLKKILEGIEKTPTSTLVLNGDESLLGELDLPNPVDYYGFMDTVETDNKIDINADAKFCKKCKSPYSYNFITYNHLGDFYCDNCGYHRPNLSYTLDKIDEISSDNSKITINDNNLTLNIPGVYNIYNALCAFSIAKVLGIEDSRIISSLENQNSSFGRQENINIEDKKVKIILVKNPAGFNQAIDTIAFDTSEINLTFLLNDNYADGRDVSWIWDVNFEKLNKLNIEKLFVGGIRLFDMATRLKIAGMDTKRFVVSENYESILEGVKATESNTVYILATYTSMINFRKYLFSKGYIKNLW